MMPSVPASAPGTPPLTPASTSSMPDSRRRAPIAAVCDGLPLVRSTTIVPGSAPSTMPSGPKQTCSTSFEVGSERQIVRAAPATARGESAGCAPASVSRASASGCRSSATRPKPAPSTLRAIGPPMLPSPIKPIVSAIAVSLRAWLLVPGRDSNPHARRPRVLSPLRMPIPPPRRCPRRYQHHGRREHVTRQAWKRTRAPGTRLATPYVRIREAHAEGTEP